MLPSQLNVATKIVMSGRDNELSGLPCQVLGQLLYYYTSNRFNSLLD